MGLVAYESSDDEEEVQTQPEPQKLPVKTATSESNDAPQQPPSLLPKETTSQPQPASRGPLQPLEPPSQEPLGPILGPALGPSLPPPSSTSTLPEPEDIEMTTTTILGHHPNQQQPPRSPYSSTRTLLQDLTLPPNPNTSIPPSPPLSPTILPKINSLTAKFDNFLKLKREKGIHFNERIAQSRGLRNPAVMEQLLQFAGVGTSFEQGDGDDGGSKGTGQYATTLRKEVWDPVTGFPGWAGKDGLWRSQIRMKKEKERGRGERVEFVSAASDNGVLPDLRTALPGQQQLGRGGMGEEAVGGKRKRRY
ncbi:hypothetical protein QBC36DRAFT_91358 [Triangularia setosa]|uniref:HCNGP-like protein n=1 Tax=Triangularia setosa TaxID=2587417 RepID=A0AAN7A424_9PEZI|nr:hypothetical protein QBC36DRAFT_91358 [Podospora setosa]